MADNLTPQAGTIQEPQAGPVNGQNQAPAAPIAEDVAGLPEWAQRVIRDLRSESAAHRKAKTDAERVAQAAAEKALADNQQWEQLAKQHKAQLDALTPKAELADRLSEQLTAQIEARVKKLPSEVTALDPGDADIVARLAWLDKAEALAAKLTGAAQGQTGNKPAPKPAGQPTEQEAAQRELELRRRFRL